jgi:hypothetical protein
MIMVLGYPKKKHETQTEKQIKKNKKGCTDVVEPGLEFRHMFSQKNPKKLETAHCNRERTHRMQIPNKDMTWKGLRPRSEGVCVPEGLVEDHIASTVRGYH